MANVAVAKSAQALRRQRPSLSTRQTSRPGLLEDGEGTTDTVAEPYVKDTNFILKKFRGKKPSLIVHAYQKHFRFGDQPMNFAYEGGMGVFMKHLVQQTVPHALVKELSDENVTWYDGRSTPLALT